jgi:hypothetical protein
MASLASGLCDELPLKDRLFRAIHAFVHQPSDGLAVPALDGESPTTVFSRIAARRRGFRSLEPPNPRSQSSLVEFGS